MNEKSLICAVCLYLALFLHLQELRGAIRQKWIEKQMAREYKDAELDSLALIATGQDGDPSLVSPRYNALSVLRSELPEKRRFGIK